MVYTKTGDKGTTSLVGGQRVLKCSARVEAYGTVDELNSHLGLLAVMMHEKSVNLDIPFDVREAFESLYTQIKSLQNDLFVIQTLLATEDEETYSKLASLKQESIDNMEHWIDDMESKLPRLSSFVIPGGSIESAQAHVCRTVCRRAERVVVSLAQSEKVEENIICFVNRLSDYLFVVSRYVLVVENKNEIFWSAK